MRECQQILQTMQRKQDAQAFLEPVPWELYGLTDYPEIIKKPMDLGTIQERLESGKYLTPDKFAADVKLVWRNAQTYNRPDSDIFIQAEKLSNLFDQKFSKIKKGKKGSKLEKGGKGETREVTRQDRLKFSQLVHQLKSEKLAELVDMIKQNSPQAVNDDDDVEIEIEINHIDPAVLLQLNAFAAKAVGKSSAKKGKK